MISNNTFNLLLELSRTNNPTDRLQSILSYCMKEGDYKLQETEITELINAYKEIVNKKREQGLEAIKIRTLNKSNKVSKNYSKAKFFADGKGGYPCHHCGLLMPPGPVMKHKIDNDYQFWHIACVLMETALQPIKNNMETDKDYNKWKNGSK